MIAIITRANLVHDKLSPPNSLVQVDFDSMPTGVEATEAGGAFISMMEVGI